MTRNSIWHLRDGKRVYDLDSYLRAAISAWRFRDAAESLRSWHRRRHEVLTRLFLTPAPPTSIDRADRVAEQVLDHLLHGAIKHAAQAGTPFDGYLAIPKEVHALMHPHCTRLVQLRDETVTELHAMARMLLGRRYPGIETREVTSEELVQAGFDDGEEPDELDYF